VDEHGVGEPVPPADQGTAFQPVGEVLDSATAQSWSVLPAGDVDVDGIRPSGRRRQTPLVAGVAVLAVLAAAGGAYAWSALSGGGPQPASVLPASTVAVAEVDLNPSAGQKIALYQLLRKFPESSGLRSTDQSFGDWLVRSLSQGSAAGLNGSGLDFAKDVKPWLGQRFAVAAVPSGKTVEAVVVVAETDEKAAAAAMGKLRGHGATQLGYAFMDGYLVVTPGSASGAAAVVAGAQKAPLSADTQFSADVASLGSDEVVTGWVDATKAGRLLKDSLGAVPGVDAAGVGSLIGPTWKGRYVLGVHATSDSVEMRMRSFGGDPQPAEPAARLDHVAPGAFAVVSVSSPGQHLATAWKQLTAAPQYAGMLDQARQLGLTLPGDLETLLGDNLTVSVGGDPSAQPSLLAAASSKDPAAAKAVLDRLLAMAARGVTASVAQGIDGDTLYVASSDPVLAGGQTTAAARALTSTDLFRRAVADPAHAQFVLYVDLTTVWSTMKSSGAAPPSPEVEHLAAVGMSGSASGTGTDYTLRVVFS
jgi:Protein of unknown function (DUF3352)